MDWQQLVSLTIVGATAAMILRSRLGRRRREFGRGTVCGCYAVNREGPPYSVVFRARKGERAQVIVKMN
jgi:hypothetical protein